MKLRLAFLFYFCLFVQYFYITGCAPLSEAELPSTPAPLAADAAPLPKPQARTSTPTAPVITEEPSSFIAAQDRETGRLECRARGYPSPTISWLKDGQPLEKSIVRFIVKLDSGNLIFMRIVNRGPDANTGVYQCIASNTVGSAYSRNVTVQLANIKDEFRVAPTDTIGIRGKQVVLRCQGPRGIPEPTISWKKGNVAIRPSKRIQLRNGNLVINRAQKSDSGSYVCVARNSAGIEQTTPAILKINEMPKIVLAPSNKDVLVNQTVELSCEAIGDPKPKVVWSKNGGELPPNRHNLYSGMLQILRVEPSDQGEYVCTATNQAGSVSSQAFVSVKGLPEITDVSAKVDVEIGQTATLPCRARGNPPPTIFWRDLNGLELFSGGTSKTHVTSEGDLVIDSVHFRDTGVYKCHAINPMGTVFRDVKLEVLPRQSTVPPPVIGRAPQNVTTLQGGFVSLRCSSVTSPRPQIAWYKNGHPVKAGGNAVIASESLQIQNVQISDEGRYTCKATNDYGVSTKNAWLRVQPMGSQIPPPPSPAQLPPTPTRPQVVNRTQSSIAIRWENGRNSQAPVDHYMVEYYKIGSQESSWRRISPVKGKVLNVKNLGSSSSFVFLVRASNAYGSSDASPTSNSIKTAAVGSQVSNEEIQNRLNALKIHLEHAIPLKNPGQSTGSIRLKWETESGCQDMSNFVVAWQAVRGQDTQIRTATVTCSARSYDLTNVQAGALYEVRIRPIRGSLKGKATPIVFVSLDSEEMLPQKPAIHLEAVDDDQNAVSVNWATPSDISKDRITGFTVRCLSTDGSYRKSFNLNGTESGTTLRHLPANKKFEISVTYSTYLGEGETSREAQISLGDSPTEPSDTGFVGLLQKQPAIVAGLAIGLLAVVAVVVIGICYYRKTRKTRKARGLHVRSFSFTPQSGPHRISGASRFDRNASLSAPFHMTPTVGGPSSSMDSADSGGKGGLSGPAGSGENSRLLMQRPSEGLNTSKGTQNTIVSYDAKSGTVSNNFEEKPVGAAQPAFSYVADQLTRVSDIPPQFSNNNASRPSIASTQSGQAQHQSQLLRNRSGSNNVFGPSEQDFSYAASPMHDLPPPPPSPPLSLRTGISDKTDRSRGSSAMMHSTGSGRSQRSRKRGGHPGGTTPSMAPTCQYTSIDTDTGIDSPHQTPSPHRPIDMRGMPSPVPPTPPVRGASVFPYGRGQSVMQFNESHDPALNLGYLAGPSEGDSEGENDAVGQLRVGQFVNEPQRNSVAVSAVSMMNTYGSETDEREDSSSGRHSPGCESSDDESLHMESVSQVGQNRLDDDEIHLIRPNPQPRTFRPPQQEASPTRRQYPNTYHRHPAEEEDDLPLLNSHPEGPAAKPRPSRKTNSKGRRGGGKKSTNTNSNNNHNIAQMNSGSSSTSSSYHHNTGDSGMSAGVGCSTEHSSLNSNASAGSAGPMPTGHSISSYDLQRAAAAAAATTNSNPRDGLRMSHDPGTRGIGHDGNCSSPVSPTASVVSEQSGYHSTSSSCWQYHEPYMLNKGPPLQPSKRPLRTDTNSSLNVIHPRPHNFPDGKNLHYSKSEQCLQARSPERTPVLSDFNVTPTNGPNGANDVAQFQMARTVFLGGAASKVAAVRGLQQELSDVPEVSTSDFCEDYSDQSQ